MFSEHKTECGINTFLILISFQAHLPEIKVHAYFAPVTPPPSVHGGGQRLCRCCIILWQWRARGGHLCLQVLLLWSGLRRVGGGHQGRCRGEEGLDPLTAPDLWWIHRLIATGPWSVEPAPPLSSSSQRCSSPGPDVEDGWGSSHRWTFALCLSSFLSHCKDTPWRLDSWRWAGGGGGVCQNSRMTMHHVLTNKKKYSIIILDAICGVSSQPNTRLLCVTDLFSASSNTRQHGAREELDVGKCWFSVYKQ